MKKKEIPCPFCDGTGREIIGWKRQPEKKYRNAAYILPRDNRRIAVTKKCPHCQKKEWS